MELDAKIIEADEELKESSSQSSSSSVHFQNKEDKQARDDKIARNNLRRSIIPIPQIKVLNDDDLGIIPEILPTNRLVRQKYLRNAAEFGLDKNNKNKLLNIKFIKNSLNSSIIQKYNQALKNMREKDEAMVEAILERSIEEDLTSRPFLYDII